MHRRNIYIKTDQALACDFFRPKFDNTLGFSSWSHLSIHEAAYYHYFIFYFISPRYDMQKEHHPPLYPAFSFDFLNIQEAILVLQEGLPVTSLVQREYVLQE